MNIIEIYNLIFYYPVYKILVFFYSYLNDFGLAILFLTIIIKSLLFPFDIQNLKFQKKIDNIQKKIKEIEKEYKGEERIKKIISLYQQEKINPFIGIFSLIFQIPILITLYQVFLKGAKESFINPTFLGFFNLSNPNIFFAGLVAILQFFSTKPEKKKFSDKVAYFQSQLNFLFPVFTFLILIKLPSAVAFYLIFNFLFIILEKRLIYVKERRN